MWILLLGVLIGYVVPELDSLIYVFFANPQELTSQRVIYFLKKGSFFNTFRLLRETKSERKNVIFHSNVFMVVILILGFWLMTSSASYLGKGIVWGMVAHLIIDQLVLRLYHKA